MTRAVDLGGWNIFSRTTQVTSECASAYARSDLYWSLWAGGRCQGPDDVQPGQWAGGEEGAGQHHRLSLHCLHTGLSHSHPESSCTTEQSEKLQMNYSALQAGFNHLKDNTKKMVQSISEHTEVGGGSFSLESPVDLALIRVLIAADGVWTTRFHLLLPHYCNTPPALPFIPGC